MAGDESRMAGGESRMTRDCCRPEGSIHRCVRTHPHLYSYIYGLVALLDNIQSSFSIISTLNKMSGNITYLILICRVGPRCDVSSKVSKKLNSRFIRVSWNLVV
jgi:ABC-type antimicrobial peptide transport system ATPase subunit